jgi:drug/metabolite transporter (DMT)-like permease
MAVSLGTKTGYTCVIMAALAFATYSILSERCMQTHTPWTVLFYGLLFAALTWNVLHSPLAAFFRAYTPLEWGCIGFVGTFGTIVPFGLYFEGIKRISATHASITATLEPVTAGAVAMLFLGERMTTLQMVGGLVVITAIVLLQGQHDTSGN